MFYQWHQYPGERPDGLGRLIPGATNATYTSPIRKTNTTFWVRVTNSAGSVISDRATINVVSRPWLYLRRVSALPALIIDGVVTGQTYWIEYSTNLCTTNWTGLVDLTLGSKPFKLVDVQGTNSPMRFCRAVVP
jgi:hypothetical protein